jgi:hypothetical protein
MSLVATDTTKDLAGAPSPEIGLSQRDAEERLRQVGPNDPSPRKRGTLLIELLRLFLNPSQSLRATWTGAMDSMRDGIDVKILTGDNELVARRICAQVGIADPALRGLALPWLPLAGLLGFTPLPLPFLLFVGLSNITYLALVEAAKRQFFALSRQHAKWQAGSAA